MTPEWEQAVHSFADHMRTESDRAQTTRWQYCQHVRWLAESAICGPWALSTHELSTWLDQQNWSAGTRRKVLLSIRAFYAWAVAAGHLTWAPTAGIAARAARRRGPEPLRLLEAWRGPVEEFTAHLRAGSRSPGTISQYRYRLCLLAAVSSDPWTVTGQQLAQWLSNPDWAPQTKRSSRTAVRSFYRWAVRAGYVQESPADDLDTVRVPRALPRPTPEEDLRAALAAADDRTRLAIMLAAYAGLRCAEVASLHMREIADTHLVVVGKGGHHRMVPLDPAGDLAQALRAEIARRRAGGHGSGWSDRFTSPHGYLFPSPMDGGPITAHHLGRLVSSALPGTWAMHSLRHRFATNAYAGERDLMAVQQLLGHRKPETTAVYAQVPDGALMAAVAAASGRPALARRTPWGS